MDRDANVYLRFFVLIFIMLLGKTYRFFVKYSTASVTLPYVGNQLSNMCVCVGESACMYVCLLVCKTKELTRPQLREAFLSKCVFFCSIRETRAKTKRPGVGVSIVSVSILAIQFSNLTKFVLFLNLLPPNYRIINMCNFSFR